MPYWRLFFHFVWSTKNREPIIGPLEEAEIRRSFELTFADLDAIPHAVGVMPEHVHVAISVPPKWPPAEVMRLLKGASSRAINKRNDRGLSRFYWQGEYGVHSFGEQVLPTVVECVLNQSTHHANGTLWPGLERTSDDGESNYRNSNNRRNSSRL